MRRFLNLRAGAMALAVALLALFGGFPLLILVTKAFETPEGGYGLANFTAVYSNQTNLKALWNTLQVSGLAMIISVLISFPLAWVVGRTDLPGKNGFRALLLVPYMVPPFVGAIAWNYLANPRIGYLNRLFGEQVFNILSVGGMVWVFVLFHFPFAFLAISRAMERMDPTLEEAARISGAGPWRVVRDVTLPLMTPALVAGGLLVFVSVASAFGIPYILGAQNGVHVITTRVISYVEIGTPNALRAATALAVVLLVVALSLLWLANWYTSKKDYVTVSGKSFRPMIIELGKWKWPVFGFMSMVTLVFSILPIGALVATSFSRTMSKLPGPGNLTTANWSAVLSSSSTWSSMKTSLGLAVLAATLAVFIGLMIAYIKVRTNVVGRNLPDFLATFTNGTPSVVLALALIITFSGSYGLNLYGTSSILVVAYVVHFLAMAVRPTAAALEQIHPSLEEAGLASGAGWGKVLKTITMPLASPALIAGWFLVFMPAFYELSMSVLLFSPATGKPVGVMLYDLETYADPQSAAVMSVLVLSLVLVGNAVVRVASKGRVGI